MVLKFVLCVLLCAFCQSGTQAFFCVWQVTTPPPPHWGKIAFSHSSHFLCVFVVYVCVGVCD